MSEQHGSSPAPSDALPASLTSVLMQVAGAIGTGIGVLGFVVFVGGAVIWTRFNAVGVPAADAVSIVPREVLLSTGASILAPIALVGLGVVAVLFAYEAWVNLGEAPERRFEEEALRAQRDSCADAERDLRNARVAVARAQADAQNAPESEQPGFSLNIAALQQNVNTCVEQLEQARRTLHSAITENAQNRDGRTTNQIVGALALLVVATLAVTFISLRHIGLLGSIFVVLVMATTSAAAYALYVSRRKFVLFGIAAFAAACLTFASAEYFDTNNNPLLVPAAALRSDRSAVSGFLVAQTSDRVYIGMLDNGTQTHILALDRKKITDFALDEPVGIKDVGPDAHALVVDLCSTYGRDARTWDAKTHTAKRSAWPTGKDRVCSTLESGRL